MSGEHYKAIVTRETPVVEQNGGMRFVITEMRCSRCGGLHEHVYGDYEFCPRCGCRFTD